MTPEELADALAEEDPASSAVELCDPFFDVVGATDADVLRTLLPTDDEVTP